MVSEPPVDPMPAAELEPRDELSWLARALQAHLEYLAIGGAFGVPKATMSHAAPIASGVESPVVLAPAAGALHLERAQAGVGPLMPGVQRPELAGSTTDAASASSSASVAARSAAATSASAPATAASVATTSASTTSASAPATAASVATTSASTTSASAPATSASALPPAPTRSIEESRRQLSILASEISGCNRCGLCAQRTQTVFARGTGSSGLCFVGEGPGADEDAQGFPFVGAAGQLLDKMIAAMGLGRDEVYVCNIVKCRPPENRKPLPEEVAACRPYLERQLEFVSPEVIVALGATAVEGLLGTTGGITRLRGTWKLYKGRIAVMPTFHPAYLLRSPSAKHAVWDDMLAVLRHLGRPVPVRAKR